VDDFRVEKVIAPSGRIGWTLTAAGGEPVAPADEFLRYRFHSEASPNTLRGYAYDLKHFFSFLVAQGVDWRNVTPADLGTFTAWLRRPAPNVLSASRGAAGAGREHRQPGAVGGVQLRAEIKQVREENRALRDEISRLRGDRWENVR
jgi:hypothetical protein